MKMEMPRMTIAQARKMRGLRGDEAAELLGVSRVTLSKYENGRVDLTLRKAQEISRVYQVPMENLIFPSISN